MPVVPTFDISGGYSVSIEDFEYARPNGEPLLARLYRPVGRGPFAALVDLHGGAWSSFDRTIDAHYDNALAACGVVVAALDFRQAPAHRFPTPIADAIAGIRYIKQHADALDVRADAVGLIGGSTGGHLALLAALRPNAAEWETTAYVGQRDEPVDARVAFALALWPIADPLARYRYLLDWLANPRPTRDPVFRPEHLRAGHEAFFSDEAAMARASVPRLLAAGEAEHLPPIWVGHPELDENVTLEMSEALVTAYRSAGGSAELAVFPGVGHAFAHVPGAQADVGIAAMRAFIARQLAA
jgi:acetyl esterase/lipase